MSKTIGMLIPRAVDPLEMELVIAINVADMSDYVKKEDLGKMHVMTWGNEIPAEQEGNNNA